MIRGLLSFVFLLLIAVAGGLYYTYGEVEPCRALAVEHARRAEASVGLPIAGGLERWNRLGTSQMTFGECARDLVDSWRERLAEQVE